MGQGPLRFNSVNLTGGSGSWGDIPGYILHLWSATMLKITLHILDSNTHIILETAKKSIYFWHISPFLKKSSVFLLLPNKTHSRTQSYSVNKAVYLQSRRQAPAQGSLVENGEGNLPCPMLSPHTQFEDMWSIIWWCTRHRNAVFYSSCHTRLKNHYTNTNKWNSVSIAPGLSPLLILP